MQELVRCAGSWLDCWSHTRLSPQQCQLCRSGCAWAAFEHQIKKQKKNKKKTGSILQKVSPPPVVSVIAVFDEMFHCCVIHVICDVVITVLFTTEVGHHGETGGVVTCPFVEPVHNEMVLDFLCTLCSN